MSQYYPSDYYGGQDSYQNAVSIDESYQISVSDGSSESYGSYDSSDALFRS